MSNDPVIQQALTELDSTDHLQRLAALYRLRSQQDDEIAPRLIPLLRDPASSIRRLTAEVLAQNSSHAVVQALIETLYDTQPDVRSAAADALGQIGDHAAVPALIDALYDEVVEVRFAAAQALGQLGDQRAVVDLIHMLDNDDAPVAAMAAMSLHKIGTPEALAAIQHLREADGDYNFDFMDEVEPAGKAEEKSDLDDTIRRYIPPDLIRRMREAELEADEAEAVVPPKAAKEAEETLRSGAAPQQAEAAEVQFSAYYPREVAPEVWYALRAYIFNLSAAEAVADDAALEFGGTFASMRQVVRATHTQIEQGALITATPELAGFQFNPPTAQVGFYEEWERFDFKLRAVDAPLDQSANGKITFSVEGVIVADVPLSIYVGAPKTGTPKADASQTGAPGMGGSVPTNNATLNVTRPIYQSIFCSYSHKDTLIVERVERAYKALGLDFLRDVVTLKSGQDWNAELLRMIDRADIFQLFWSNAAAESKYVRQEWEHALSLNRQSEAFIRPVYWQHPMPPVPPELGAIHFAYEPTLDD